MKQLVLSKEAAFQLLETAYEDYSKTAMGHRSPPNAGSLLVLLHRISKLFSSTTIIIDGLDEISTKRFDTLDLLKQIGEAQSNTRVLLASRSEPEIEQSLSDFECMSIAARSSDLEQFVAREIEKRIKRGELNIKNMDLKEQIIKRLIHGAEGM